MKLHAIMIRLMCHDGGDGNERWSFAQWMMTDHAVVAHLKYGFTVKFLRSWWTKNGLVQ